MTAWVKFGMACGVVALIVGAYLLGVALFDNDTVCVGALNCVTVPDTEQQVIGAVTMLVGGVLVWRAAVAR